MLSIFSLFASFYFVLSHFCSLLTLSVSIFLQQPLIKEFIRFGAQFVGYREYASKAEGTDFLLLFAHDFLLLFRRDFDLFLTILAEKLAEANKHADTLAQKLEQS
jgi:hypothetical protein